jgi:hypothetical protein
MVVACRTGAPGSVDATPKLRQGSSKDNVRWVCALVRRERHPYIHRC